MNNEDKKTRKELLELIGCMHDADSRKERWLAWLEKQGQKPFNYECANIPQKDFSPSIGIEIPFGAKDSELQEATYLIPEGFHAEIESDKVVMKKGKQKPAWDERDESHLIHCVRLINNAEGCSISEQENAIVWLKSIKQRIGG